MSENQIYYEDAQNKRDALSDALSEILDKLDTEIIKARDRNENPIPVYATKCRIKTANSIYLKTKRKPTIKNIGDITDIAGYRILCLFEEDIFNVHKFLIKNVFETFSFKLEEFKMFNWGVNVHSFKKIVEEQYKDCFAICNNKGSGYKSVHYAIRDKDGFHIEIQLRTLIQDVWGELEHKLSYKQGSTHPYIRKSFLLLARDLETNDQLVNHLKDIYDKENLTLAFETKNMGIRNYFDYDISCSLERYFKKEEVNNAYLNYHKYVKEINIRRITQEQINEARRLYEELHDLALLTNSKTKDEEKEISYWLEMEKTFWFLCEKSYEKVEKIYRELLKKHKEEYILNFRMGEIKFINGEIEDALFF